MSATYPGPVATEDGDGAAEDDASTSQAHLLLDHEGRRELYDLIVNNMGLCEAEISRRTDLSRSTVTHHLHRLVRGGLVRAHKQANRVYYFQRSLGLLELQRAIVGTRNPTRRRIIRLMHQQPSMSWRAISHKLGLTSRAVRWHMEQMEQMKLITVQRRKGICRARLGPALEAVITGDPSKLGDDIPPMLRRPQDFRDALVTKPWRVSEDIQQLYRP